MKYIAPLICLSLIAIATPALALQGNECLESSKRLNPAERESFMKTCLAKAQDPANVQKEERKQKSAQCEQNARNKKLQGNEKAKYHDSCMNKNDASAVAKSQSQASVAPSHKQVSSDKPKGASHKSVSNKHSSGKPARKKQKLHKKNEKPASKQPETSTAK
jgi:hypothetical protein